MDAAGPEPQGRTGEFEAADAVGRQPDAARGDLRHRLERLPFGHPSSPYDDSGSSRAGSGIARLRELELPLPEESSGEQSGDRGADQTGAGPADLPADSTWAEALPELRAQWERHLQRWPSAETARADRTSDEPGSWRGDGGQYLNAEENLAAGHALERVRTAETEVTQTLRSVESAVPGAQLVGLKFCLKGDERYKEKVADDLRAMPDRTISEITSNVPDSLRYTFQFSSFVYVDGYQIVCQRLQNDGHRMALNRNSWTSHQYRGINSRWHTPDGQLFEVQFHEPESFAAKQLSHTAYERIRNRATGSTERRELYVFQSKVSAAIPIPNGTLEVPDYHQESG
jgi:hypothetical protein